MICVHPERPNVLSLPSMGNPHCCRECWDAQPKTPFKGKREDWERDLQADYGFDGHTLTYETTSGRRTIAEFQPGERFK